jgi:hypothetical protein
MSEINQVVIRLYKFLVSVGRVTVDELPEPYKSVIESEVE